MDWLIDFFAGLEFWHWLALGLVLLLAEVVTGSTYLLWPAVAAWLTGLLAMALPLSWELQLVFFAVSVVLLLLFARPLVRNSLLAGPETDLNETARALAGSRAVAASAFEQGVGRVKLGDTEWRAVSDDAIASGDAVDVVSVDGATLNVRRRT